SRSGAVRGRVSESTTDILPLPPVPGAEAAELGAPPKACAFRGFRPERAARLGPDAAPVLQRPRRYPRHLPPLAPGGGRPVRPRRRLLPAVLRRLQGTPRRS